MPLIKHDVQPPVAVGGTPLTVFTAYPLAPKNFMYADVLNSGDDVTLVLSPGLPGEESRVLQPSDRINFNAPNIHDPATATVVSAGASTVTVDFIWR